MSLVGADTPQTVSQVLILSLMNLVCASPALITSADALKIEKKLFPKYVPRKNNRHEGKLKNVIIQKMMDRSNPVTDGMDMEKGCTQPPWRPAPSHT